MASFYDILSPDPDALNDFGPPLTLISISVAMGERFFNSSLHYNFSVLIVMISSNHCPHKLYKLHNTEPRKVTSQHIPYFPSYKSTNTDRQLRQLTIDPQKFLRLRVIYDAHAMEFQHRHQKPLGYLFAWAHCRKP